MASGYLKVSPEKLQATSSSFSQTASKVNQLTQQMTQIVNGLTGAIWSGEAQTAYNTKFQGLQDDMTRIYKMIEEHANDLTEIAQQFISAEQANAEMANGLSSDVIV